MIIFQMPIKGEAKCPNCGHTIPREEVKEKWDRSVSIDADKINIKCQCGYYLWVAIDKYGNYKVLARRKKNCLLSLDKH